MIKHTTQCALEKEHLGKWLARYPDACAKCKATGGIVWQENQAPLGSGYIWNETLEEECNKCLGRYQCPRCSHSWLPKQDRKNQKICDAFMTLERWFEKQYKGKHFGIATKEYPLNYQKVCYNLGGVVREVRWRFEEANPYGIDISYRPICDKCGWNWGKGLEDSMPEYECYCWEDNE